METKRLFTPKVSTFLIAAATIADAALDHVAALQEQDASINKSFLANLRTRIDTAIKNILGADNAKALRKSTAELLDTHTKAKYDLHLTKVFVENKYAGDDMRRNELLNNLGFHAFYTAAARGTQYAMGQLLSRLDNNLTPGIEAELIGKGLPQPRILALRKYAAIYTNTNIKQEGNKDARKEGTDANVKELNAVYTEIISICKLAQLVFKRFHVVHDSFVFTKVVRQQSSYAIGSAITPPNPVS